MPEPTAETNDQTQSFYGGVGKWILMLVVLIVGVWLWISWRNAWFPFQTPLSPTIITSPEPAQGEILQSLTATSSPDENPSAILKKLTPPRTPKTPPADEASILDSLTPAQ